MASFDFGSDDVLCFMRNTLPPVDHTWQVRSGRLTQLELCCYKLERSVGEFRADMIRDQSEADLRMKSLVKRIHEVHRSVQIIRDKQELYETHKELANSGLTKGINSFSQLPEKHRGIQSICYSRE
ncbi:hypothetical protein HPP92_009481 [Vanilla planifolia]|uniref:Uncharacterized protein n=1 Tax=Vanilla planifolia TaxID=51239 RepID=A0A835R7W1_VANPL|nr:hypothetical protein HPP92_009481 [Vanilla planifolia]